MRRFGPFGGKERVAVGFVRWLVAQGHTVDVWSNTFNALGIAAHHRPLRAGGRGVMWKAKSLATAVAAVPVDEYDVFLHFERGARSGAYRAGSGCAAAQALKEGPAMSWALIRAIDERACKAATPLIVNSEMVRDEILEHYGVDDRRVRLVRNGVDLSQFKPGHKAEVPTLVFVGDNPRRKGLKTALEVLQRLPEAHLEVVGQVGARGPQWAEQLGVGRRVRFHGGMACPSEVVSRAHAMILPTRYDASANACLEAMACGVPVVTTRCNGASELSPEPWLVIEQPSDADRFAEVLKAAMQDETLPEACRGVAEAHPAAVAFAALLDVISEGEA